MENRGVAMLTVGMSANKDILFSVWQLVALYQVLRPSVNQNKLINRRACKIKHSDWLLIDWQMADAS